jgi:hypothetical protein
MQAISAPASGLGRTQYAMAAKSPTNPPALYPTRVSKALSALFRLVFRTVENHLQRWVMSHDSLQFWSAEIIRFGEY